MADVPAGRIFLRDEGTRAYWKAEVPAFRLAVHQVTRAEYAAVLGRARDGRARWPVTEVSWPEAVEFCDLLSLAQGLRPYYREGAGDGYRLPTEAEWEHACRAGTAGERYGELDAIAWHRGNSGGAPHEVGSRQPNAWGLHDMIGNVWEWCWDLYDPARYGEYRVFRGGGWLDPPWGCRASARRRSHPSFRIDDLGFRVARSVSRRRAG
ncbi:formylglycine-generating enzyme family protein [Nonomuraea typhae]|uniref:formylglycine-generating enzyme family protein n=1 Tax=Nonomuraea typhae TaxID=2603600 RepID=UPI0012FCFC40|nr:formylglycine-generating enzyme family protein [Nonomuraea typhae]